MREPHGPSEVAASSDGVLLEYRRYAAAVRRAGSLGAHVAPRYLPGAEPGCNAAEAALAIRRAAAERGPDAPLLTYLAVQVEHLGAELAEALEERESARRERGAER